MTAATVRPAGPSMVARVMIGAIDFYRMAVSPLRPPCCRYAPTCSEYAVTAIARHGTWRGSWLAVRRLLRCGPWHRGGFDPVPELQAGPPAPMSPAGAPCAVASHSQERP